VFLASRVALAALAVTLAAALAEVQVTVELEVMQWLLEAEEY
jgi:hypothetical protein